MKIVAIIQARMASTRLPGKVLVEVSGQPLLQHMIERVKRAKKLDSVVVATSEAEADQAVAWLCEASGTVCYRGRESDVLDRYYRAAVENEADVVVRLTADCPLIDPEVIDQVIGFFHGGEFDYVSNIIECSYPDGLDTEVFTREALERTWREARLKSEREHVTPYLRNHPELFRQGNMRYHEDLSSLRWTVDTPRDLDFVRTVYSNFSSNAFGMGEVLDLLKHNPQLGEINQGIERNEGYRKSLVEDGEFGPGEAAPVSGTGQRLYDKARTRIPGGTQLLSKRPEMFLPEQWPSYYSRARGAEVWDLDGNRFLDMSYNGIGACVLGAADPDVDEAVKAAIDQGSMSTLNCPEEVELADLLCELHPWAEMVRYARSGGEAMALAVRIARAHTRRDRVAFCGYHGWHDWYLAANLAETDALDGHLLPGLDPAGVPRGLRGTALPFHYNRIEELRAIVSRHGDELGAIVMEPVRDQAPAPGFLEEVREIATRSGAVLIFDEITSAFRLNTGGAHLLYHINPDVAVFAKAISNGYPMAAIIGPGEVMQGAQASFISSTYWTDRIGPVAALATIRKHRDERVPEHLVRSGRQVKEVWIEEGARAGLPLHVSGIDPLAHVGFEVEEPGPAHTLYTQLMLDRGFLASKTYYATYAHRDEHLAAFRRAVAESFSVVAGALEVGRVRSMLRGPVAHSGFQRLT